MQQFRLVAHGFVLVAVMGLSRMAMAADDPKPTPAKLPEPKTVAEAKKRLADAVDLLEQKATVQAKARAALDAIATKHAKVRTAEFAKVEEVCATERKAQAGLRAKVQEAEIALEKARIAESDALLALSVADARLRVAVDPKDVAAWKKKLADRKAEADAKSMDYDKAAADKKTAMKTFEEADIASRRRCRDAEDAAFKIVKDDETKLVEARRNLNDAEEQLNAAQQALRRAKEQLMVLEEQEKK